MESSKGLLTKAGEERTYMTGALIIITAFHSFKLRGKIENRV